MILKTSDITIFVGVDKNKNVSIIPYIFNKKADKIKLLDTGNIISLPDIKDSLIPAIEYICDTKMHDVFSLTTLVQAETITGKEFEKITSALSKFYSSESKLKNKPEEEIDLEYRNF